MREWLVSEAGVVAASNLEVPEEKHVERQDP